MSGIIYLKRIDGATNSLVQCDTTDTTVVALEDGYLTAQLANIISVSEGGWTWLANDMIILSASDGVSLCVISADLTTLIVIASHVVPVPESSTDNIVAHAGGGQTLATHLTTAINRITTVASAGDSVLLLKSKPGQYQILINNGANPMQVFGQGTDTINGQTNTVGISQLANSVAVYYSAGAGLWESADVTYGYADGNLMTVPFATGITAQAGGTQAAAFQLVAAINNVSTVAANADSVKLPASAPGLSVTVINSGANQVQVYGLGADTINSVTATTGVSQAPGVIVTYRCVAAGNWLASAALLTLDVIAGYNGAAGKFISYPAAANSGTLIYQAITNTSGNFSTTIRNAAAVGQSQIISIPDSGVAASNFIIANSATSQTIYTGSLILAVGNFTATLGNIIASAGTITATAGALISGAATGGFVGELLLYPTTTSTGSLQWKATPNTTNTNTIFTTAAFGQGTTITYPDPATATALGILSPAALVNGNLIKASGTLGLIADAGITTTDVMTLSGVNTMTGTSRIITVKANGTEAANAVTASGMSGVITTSSLSTAGGSAYAITWTNTFIAATNVILLTIMGGTNTTQNITLTAVAGSGASTLTIYNNTAMTALNGTIFIGYTIL